MRERIARFAGACAAVSCAIGFTSTARAQERTYFQRSLPAPTNALELRAGTGYTQGFGTVAPGRGIADVAGAGIGVHLDADYRVTPLWSLGLQGEYQEFRNVQNMAARGVATNVGVTFHAAPILRGDPWLRVGAGYRLLWDVSPPATATTARHGFELAKATVGYDIRLSEAVAIAPQVGADVNLFLWQTVNGINSALASGQIGTFLFAGVQGRFDVAGEKTAPAAAAVHPPGFRSSLSDAELMQ
jgi:hypothetical protein